MPGLKAPKTPSLLNLDLAVRVILFSSGEG
jgi:hypothetical protein